MMTAGERTVVVVDAYASAGRLVRTLLERGHPCVMVQSTREIPPAFRPAPGAEPPGETIVHTGDWDATVEAVAKHDPLAVIAGLDHSVALTDALNQEFGLPGNDPALSRARYDKHAQQEAVRAAGLRSPRQLLVTAEDELAAWHAEIGGRIVVKPVHSARNDKVSFCDTTEAARAAYRSILGRASVYAAPNRAVVAQEYLVGPEYVVNTVSRDGRHRVTDVWKYTKVHVNGVRDRINGAIFVPPGERHWEPLVEYTFGVLDALGIRHGPTHLEVMVTADGPCLIEAGARFCGADTAYYAELAAGESQVSRTVTAYLEPERFATEHEEPYVFRRYVAMAFLASPVSGTLRSYPLLPEVERLDSFHDVRLNVRPGGYLHRTVNDDTEPMSIGLANRVEELLMQDFGTVCYLDGAGFYDVAAT
jgi:biotin carboxylase